MNYWMTVFNEVTWPQFLDMSSKVCAYTEPRGKRVPNIDVGDQIICYIAKAKSWGGVLRVSGQRFSDDKRIFSGGPYPIRIPVEPIYLATLEQAIPMDQLEGKLSFFPSGGSGKDWAPYVRNSPRKFHVPDAEAVVAEFQVQREAA